MDIFKKGGALHLNNLESPTTKDALCQVWLKNGPVELLNLSIYLRFFVIISPLERVGPSFEQTWIPYAQGCIVPSLVEIGPVVPEKKIFKISQCISLFRYHLLLGIGRGLSFEQTWINFTHWCFVPSLVEIGPVVLEKKSLRQHDDDGQILIRKAHLSLPLAHVS